MCFSLPLASEGVNGGKNTIFAVHFVGSMCDDEITTSV
jgi:hypothetical protein